MKPLQIVLGQVTTLAAIAKVKKKILVITVMILLTCHTNYAQSDAKARLNVFWKMVGISKRQNQIPNQLNTLIYEIIANRYPSLSMSEVMEKFETIDKNTTIQNDVFLLVYKNYAQGNSELDKYNLDIVFDNLCNDRTMGHWVADYAIKTYSTPKLSSSNKFQGIYTFEGKPESKAEKTLKIHYAKNGDIVFYFLAEYDGHSGALYGRLKLNKNGNLQYSSKNSDFNCSLELVKSNDRITIKTNSNNCPFGARVSANGEYITVDNANPDFFIGRGSQEKVYFNLTPPEKYRE